VTVALLVMSCPCALSMSVPAALAARHAARLRADGQPDSVALDAATRRIARQNLHGSLAWHLLMAPLAACGWVQPWVAAITMLLSSLAVAANAWRLTRPLCGGAAGQSVARASGAVPG
jgi:cation transport ATPase